MLSDAIDRYLAAKLTQPEFSIELQNARDKLNRETLDLAIDRDYIFRKLRQIKELLNDIPY